MNYCYRCGTTATYYIKSREKWSCNSVAQKCPAVREKIGKSNAISLRGKQMPAHVKEILSKANTGRICTDETKEKIRQSNLDHWVTHKRIPWNKDKPETQIAWNKGKKKQESLEIISRDDPIYSNFRKYRNRVSVRTKKTYDLFKEDINPLNLPLGKCGINDAHQVDHILSVRLGFEQGVSIEDISAKENLQILHWLENVKKYDGKR